MPRYADRLNRHLLRHIPLTARVILDVGCGTDALAVGYRRLNPRARVHRMRTHSDFLAESHRLDAAGGADCILNRDVLECLADPWSLLRAQAQLLNQDGTILICLPNHDHWRHAEAALRGEAASAGKVAQRQVPDLGGFPALPCSLSIDAMSESLARIGLTLCAVYPLIPDPDAAAAFASALAPALRQLGIDPDDFASRSAPERFVWCARKAPLQLLTVAASMLAPVGGVSHVRVLDPLQAMATDPSVITYLSPGGDRERVDAHSPRIFVLHRPALTGQDGLATIQALLRDDWLIVTEFDDHPDHFETMRGENQFSFAGVHAVQTSTPALGALLCQRNPELAVFPNAIRALPELRNFADPHTMTLFFGALNRENDWAPLMPALNAVAASVGERLRFCVLHDRNFFEALDTPHKTFTPICDYDAYMERLGSCEISFMPLLDTPFNRAKSDLKFIEAGACRVVALASDVVYAASIEDGRTGLLFRNPGEMSARLLRLIAMPSVARDLADAARAHVADKRMLAYQVAPRLHWYRSLWERREALTEALTARLRLAGVG